MISMFVVDHALKIDVLKMEQPFKLATTREIKYYMYLP
jgi:hypothetical protein